MQATSAISKTPAESRPRTQKPVHWTVVNNYRLRAGSFVTAFVVITTHVWDKGYGPILWLLMTLQFLVYPHLMYLRAARAKDTKAAENNNMLIDAAMFGLWMGALRFPLLITFLLFITALVNNAVSGGIKGLLQCVAVIAGGILLSIPFFGWHVAPETGWLTAWLSMIIGSVYLIVIGLLAYGANQRLRKTRIKLSESNATLALTLDNLQATQSRLEQANTDFRRLLDNSGQGFLSFGPDLVIDAQYSLACESMLGCSPAGCHAPELFFRDDPAKADLLCTIITSVLETADTDVRESMLSLLPAQIERDGLILKMEYKALDNAKFMLVLTDITTERRMAALLESERRRLELIVMAVSDSRNFFETIDAFRTFLATGLARLLQSGTAPVLLAKELYREIHTYKGLLSQFSFPGTPQALHEIETQLASLLALGEALSVHPLSELLSAQALQKPFEADLAMLSEALGEDFLLHGDSIVLSDAQARQLEALAIRLLRGETVDTSVAEIRALLQEIGTLRKVSFKDVLLGFDGLVRQAAKRMDKEVAPLQVTGGEEVWIDPNDYRAFLHSLVHVFRNAVAHGIESPEQRWEAQKDEMGKISCSVAVQGHSIHLSIADDGAGLNLAALRQRALANKIYTPEEVAHIPDETIAQLVFVDAISTQDEVNELAGRGMGLAAVQSETRKLGGDVLVKTTPAQGTQLVFTLPVPSDGVSEGGQHTLSQKLHAEVQQVMQSALSRARSYFENEFGISEIEVESGTGDVNSLTLLDMTAIIGMGGQINLLIAFSFQASLIDTLYQRMTSDLNIAPETTKMYREAAAGDVVNTILGHCTMDLQKLDRQGISMTPPVILDEVKTIQGVSNSMFYTQSMKTALGRMNISLVGPRELFETNLEYASR